MERSKLVGREAEAKCAEYLRRKGYEIVGMNYACRGGEIDIIAAQYEGSPLARRILRKRRGYIVFVEVKHRARSGYGEPREAVTRQKQEKIRLTAKVWLTEHDTELQPRFDVVEVFFGGGEPRFNHIENAF